MGVVGYRSIDTRVIRYWVMIKGELAISSASKAMRGGIKTVSL